MRITTDYCSYISETIIGGYNPTLPIVKSALIAAIALQLLAAVCGCDVGPRGATGSDVSSTELRPDEIEANRCFEQHGVRISPESGAFELRGDLNAGQEAYFDPSCKHLISPEIQERVRTFFRGLDAQVVACLQAKGYSVEIDEKIGFDATNIPGEKVRSCIRAVFRAYA
jgi:hypothetical protein